MHPMSRNVMQTFTNAEDTWFRVKEVAFFRLKQKIKSFLACGAALKCFLSQVDTLGSCRHLVYTFQGVSSNHSFAVSEAAAASHSRQLIERKIDELGHFKRL